MGKERHCDACGRLVGEKEIMYVLKLEMFAEAEMPELSEADLAHDHLEEIDELLSAMAEMDAEELTDEVYECYMFRLCPECRTNFHQRLKTHRPESKQDLEETH